MNHTPLLSPIPGLACLLLTCAGCSKDDSRATPSPLDGGREDAGAIENSWRQLAGSPASHFHNTVERTLTRENVGTLVQRWVYKTDPNPTGTVAVVNGVVFASARGGLVALDAKTGKEKWKQPEARGGSSPTVVDGVVYAAVTRATLVALDAETGRVLWSSKTDEHPFAGATSSPVVVEDRVLIGVDSGEEGSAAQGATFKGSVVAFDISDGRELWRHITPAEGSNGAAVWSTVSVDLEARRVFGTTGNNYTETAGPNSDSIFCLELDTGARLWNTQLEADDVFTVVNMNNSPDYDFGTNPVLYEIEGANGPRKMLAAGQKSGIMWGLDRETGQVVWQTEIQPGHMLGGILNNGAYDGERLFVAGNRGSRMIGTLASLDPSNGTVRWERDYDGRNWSPITIANGVGFLGSGTILSAFDARTGDNLYDYDTRGTLASGAVVVDGWVYVSSGVDYGFPGIPPLTVPNDEIIALSLPGQP